jgi:hypothetical protein
MDRARCAPPVALGTPVALLTVLGTVLLAAATPTTRAAYTDTARLDLVLTAVSVGPVAPVPPEPADAAADAASAVPDPDPDPGADEDDGGGVPETDAPAA